MFNKWFNMRKKENSIMNKIIEELSVTNNWIRDKLKYRNTEDPNLVIRWGREYFYDSHTFHRTITSPISMEIPYRYRRKISKLIGKIDKQNDPNFDELDKLNFLDEYLQGKYEAVIKIKSNSNLSEIRSWFDENGINDFYITSNMILFKNIEDAVAYKLGRQEYDN